MTTPEPHGFARDWLAAWNAHDVEAVLRHFHDDVVFTSPVAARVLPESGGVLRGKEELRRYWTEGLRLIPDLRFAVEAVYAGVSAIVITYRNQKAVLVNEVLIFDGDLVREGHGTYPGDDPNPAGARD
ncbi:nuclear transport factor 2 family protein [Jiangella endophytica]|uniref:nuclear transport factor 2 family protein n=1 Tax=Jiangella endophytica TaxID=1623398 RepID=UPI000E34EFE4|nr:nuclear transport factor 2 family protein [Jiangella endophytica]